MEQGRRRNGNQTQIPAPRGDGLLHGGCRAKKDEDGGKIVQRGTHDELIQEDGKLVWECPKCGNRDQNKLNVARRTCGYIGTQFWNQGRTQEIKDRVLHL